ncbi:MFS transporter [Planomonospora sp. ID91781]|uniref:MFS transporter n=2 Tax=Planomonospora parontospora TaxID=58119 RepID=A0AA37BMJ9_9ACTN|nr:MULTISPECIES: MFS transporter [Planomonospora]MBG0822754.1 MFS transporter [Planomonospora sp. ID91781]GGK92813.1 MFS transporter [Planomonospora parontospora]GII12071.1 MFS transporter [Planomonospora parontospora subsp. parontospora]
MAKASLGRHADFNRLWAGQTVSNFGDKISLLALPTIAIVTLGGGPVEVGVLGTLRFLPFFLLAPLAGLVADRVSRRSIMIAADLGRFLALASIPVAFALDAVTLPHLYVVAAVVGVLTTFFEVSYQSWLPQLIGTENLVEGNTKLQISRSLAEALGAGAGGALMQVLGAARAVTVDAFTFLISLVALLFIRHREVRERVEGRRNSAAADMKEGMRTLFGTPVLRSLFVSNVVVNFGAAIGDALILVYAYNVLGLSPGQVGIAWAVMAVFVIVGAVLSEQVAKALTLGRTLVLVAVVLGAGYILVPSAGAVGGFAGLLVVQAVLGFVSPIFDIHVLSLVQGVTPNDQMGRVGGTALAAVYGALSVGYAAGGVIGETVGLTPGLVLAGVIIALGGLTLLLGPVAAIREQPGGEEQDVHEEGEPEDGTPEDDPERPVASVTG